MSKTAHSFTVNHKTLPKFLEWTCSPYIIGTEDLSLFGKSGGKFF
jgi:hypothetical protein